MRYNPGVRRLPWLFAALLLLGCGDDEPLAAEGPRAAFDDEAKDELIATGVTKYFGQFTADSMESYETFDAYTFKPRDDGPTCIFGDPYRVSVRDTGSKDLLIYFQGGGACFGDSCGANSKAGVGVQPVGWTDADAERNPALYDFNVVFVSYCDGSVFSGDNVTLAADGSVERRHRGLANLSAALDIAKERFPSPRRVLIAGSSAGGYGTIVGTAVVRMAYEGMPLFVINDAGVGVTNPEDDALINAAKDEWKFAQFVPPSCEGCLESKQFTSLVKWGLDHDPSMRVGVFSAYEDGIIAGLFLGMPGGDYRKLILEETGKVHDAHPDRYQRYFIEGGAHTALLAGYSDVSVRGTRLVDWTAAMLGDGGAWNDVLE